MGTSSKDMWISSLIAHAESNDVKLHITGQPLIVSSTEPLAQILSTEELASLEKTNIRTVGDLTEWSEVTGKYEWATNLPMDAVDVIKAMLTKRRWVPAVEEGIPTKEQWEATPRTPPQCNQAFRVGQVFMVNQGSGEEMACEFLGF